jgi:hypothetical protein
MIVGLPNGYDESPFAEEVLTNMKSIAYSLLYKIEVGVALMISENKFGVCRHAGSAVRIRGPTKRMNRIRCMRWLPKRFESLMYAL